jgi:hypothetical protein
MNYVNFEDAITANHGIILENWPLKEFCNPSAIKSRNEVTVLLRSWESGTTRFRLMDTREWKAWSERRFQQDTSGDDHASNDHADSDLNLAISDQNADHASSDHAASDLNLATSDQNANSGDPTTEQADDTSPAPTSTAGDDPTTEQADDTSPSSPSTSSTSPTASATHKRPATSEPSRSRTKKRAALLAADNFINSTAVTDLTGNAMLVHKKKRKERSDKGIRRGKRPAPPVAGA